MGEQYVSMPSPAGGTFAVCMTCGSMVLSETRHDEFHAEVRAAKDRHE